MKRLSNITFILYFFVILIPIYAQEAVPNMKKSFDAFQKDRQEKHSLTDEQKSIMNNANIQLDKINPDPGLKSSTKAPNFILPNAFGENVELYEELKKGPVILVFYRGAWCPFCNIQLQTLQKSLPHFKKHNASLIAISPQKPEFSIGQIEKDQLQFQVLSDLDYEVIKAYNLFFELPPDLNELYITKFQLDITKFNGENRIGLPIPGTLVIGEDAIIVTSFAEVDYKKRMEVSSIIDYLEAYEFAEPLRKFEQSIKPKKMKVINNS